jgi:hypothetical protein
MDFIDYVLAVNDVEGAALRTFFQEGIILKNR